MLLMTETKKVEAAISIEEIKEKAKGTLVEIPDWDNKGTISVRLRSIDVTPLLVETGNIPNSLVTEVATMFDEDSKPVVKEGKSPENTQEMINTFAPMLDTIAKEALAEPTYEAIQEIYPLNLQQKIAIFQFVIGGIDKFKPFRT